MLRKEATTQNLSASSHRRSAIDTTSVELPGKLKHRSKLNTKAKVKCATTAYNGQERIVIEAGAKKVENW